MRRPAQPLSSEQVIANAQALVPTLRERAIQTDRDRRVPDASFEALQQAGLLHIFKPARYGGFELGLFEYVSVGMELGRGCGSTAWIFSLLCEHCWFISLFPCEAQDEIWGDDSYNVSAASLAADAARSRVERAPGGFRISGTFPFASGSDHAQYLLLGGFVDGEAHLFLVPKRELTMIDDWFVLGLRGTGSRSYAADDVFVPAYRAVARQALFEGRTEGPRLHPSFDLLKAPRTRVAPFVTSAPIVGMAQGAVDAFPDVVRDMVRRSGRVATTEAAQLAFAESAAETHAAQLVIESDAQETMQHVRCGQPIPAELQVRLSRDSAYVGRLARQSVDRLHTVVGARGIFDTHPMQRALRDVHTGLAQASMQWESRALGYAELAFGLKAADAVRASI